MRILASDGEVAATYGPGGWAFLNDRLAQQAETLVTLVLDDASTVEGSIADEGGVASEEDFHYAYDLAALVGGEVDLSVEKGGAGSGYHGHEGRPGQRGGSASASAGTPDLVTPDAKTIGFSKGVLKTGPGQPIADVAGVDRRYATRVMETWIGNSTTGVAALEIQEAVAEEFGLEMPQWQKDQLAKHRKTLEDWPEDQPKPDYLRDCVENAGYGWGQAPSRSALLKDHLDIRSANRAIVRAMYDQTQSVLAEAGIDEITLYRGIRVRELSVGQGQKLALAGNGPASSWSVKEIRAKSFAGKKNKTAQEESHGGFVVRMTVPRNRILSSAQTGFGWSPESEVVILGGSSDVAAVVTTYNR